jgi:hypothetical protein
MIKIKKNTILNQGSVDKAFNASAPKIAVTTVPKITYKAIIAKP